MSLEKAKIASVFFRPPAQLYFLFPPLSLSLSRLFSSLKFRFRGDEKMKESDTSQRGPWTDKVLEVCRQRWRWPADQIIRCLTRGNGNCPTLLLFVLDTPFVLKQPANILKSPNLPYFSLSSPILSHPYLHPFLPSLCVTSPV